MNYKSIMICGALAGFMPRALCMEQDGTANDRQASKEVSEASQMLVTIQALKEAKNDRGLERLVLSKQVAFDLMDRKELAELSNRTFSFKLQDRAKQCIAEFDKAEKACIQEQIDFDKEPFASVMAKQKPLPDREAHADLLEACFIMGDLAKELDVLRLEYIKNKTDSQKE